MKNLILVRHAKSSWDLPLSDIDRPISQKGLNDAFLISDIFKNYLPNRFLVWSSCARRAKETSLIFSQNLLFSQENIIFKKELYTFDEHQLFQQIKTCQNQVENLIVFCHNDAITTFVNKHSDDFIKNVPTSGLVVIEFNEEQWCNINRGKLKLKLFPKHFNVAKENEYLH